MEEKNVNYKEFLARHDLLWDVFPTAWDEAPFLGNGLLGAMIYKMDGNVLRVDMGNSLVCDHRELNADKSNLLFARCRLPVGHFELLFNADLAKCGMRLDLFNACLEGDFSTGGASVQFKSMIHTDESLFFMLFSKNSGLPLQVRFVPSIAKSPRQSYGLKYKEEARTMQDYQPNPIPEFTENEGISLCIQKLSGHWETVTAWVWGKMEQGTLLAATVLHGKDENPRREATALLQDLCGSRIKALFQNHYTKWNAYYTKSFLSVPDASLEGFYWIQMYKLHSATRPDRVIMDNQGPWLQETPWPAIWWNLNVQLAYSPVFAANHAELFESVSNALKKYRDNLICNVLPKYREDSAALGTSSDYELNSHVMIPGVDRSGLLEIGNLTWILHSCWQYYRVTMDKTYLSEFFFPLLKRSVSHTMHFLFEQDGILHLMPTASPEYGIIAEDTNYELSLLRWGLKTLLLINGELLLNDQQASRWYEILDKLSPYPVTEATGFLIAKDTPYIRSHRHYSHLLMAYPLYLVNREQEGSIELIEKTINQWQSLTGALQGYSFTGAASLYAALGKGDDALKSLRGLWSGFLRFNTLYKESGPVIETPLSAARSIQDMLLQSWNGKLRVFPAAPSEWMDVCFADMLAEGAFLVSASRKNGRTQFIKIKSLAGEPCVLQCDLREFRQDSEKARLIRNANGDISISLKAGGEVIIYAPDYMGDFSPEPVCVAGQRYNCYGLNAASYAVIGTPLSDNTIL